MKVEYGLDKRKESEAVMEYLFVVEAADVERSVEQERSLSNPYRSNVIGIVDGFEQDETGVGYTATIEQSSS